MGDAWAEVGGESDAPSLALGDGFGFDSFARRLLRIWRIALVSHCGETKRYRTGDGRD